MKRASYLSWDDTFMLMTHLIAKRSKDPNTQVGACIVNQEHIVMGLGYNGFPRGCSDDALPWGREGGVLESKYAFVVHAEANAIMNANGKVQGCRIYTNLFPCNECAKLIIQNGIAEIIYEEDKYAHLDQYKASRKMLELAGVATKHFRSAMRLELLPQS